MGQTSKVNFFNKASACLSTLKEIHLRIFINLKVNFFRIKRPPSKSISEQTSLNKLLRNMKIYSEKTL